MKAISTRIHVAMVPTSRTKTHLARTWSWELASTIAAGVSEVVKRLQLKTYAMSAYPSRDMKREAVAQAAIRRESRAIDSSPDSSRTESSSSSDSSSNSDPVSSEEELQEEEMDGPEET